MYCTANKNENEIIHSVNLTNQNRNHIQLYSAIIFYHFQPVYSACRYVCSNSMAVST